MLTATGCTDGKHIGFFGSLRRAFFVWRGAVTHKAEQIMAAVITTLTGLTTTGSRVYRARAYAIPKSDTNALAVFQGSDEMQEGSMFFRVRSLLTINIEAVAREATAQIDETLNTIRKEVMAAIGAAPNLGLAYEIGALEQAAEQPEHRARTATRAVAAAPVATVPAINNGPVQLGAGGRSTSRIPFS